VLSLHEVQSRLWNGQGRFQVEGEGEGKIGICPVPRIAQEDYATVGLDLHLGSWFATFRETEIPELPISKKTVEEKVTRSAFVPLGRSLVLHPGQFLLGTTLEWVRLPNDLAAHVVGKSSWGRRGLVIATATGVQPGFCGCLTLEIANVGRAPFEIEAGLPICQLFLEQVKTPVKQLGRKSTFSCSRKPTVGTVKRDWLSDVLSRIPETAKKDYWSQRYQ